MDNSGAERLVGATFDVGGLVSACHGTKVALAGGIDSRGRPD